MKTDTKHGQFKLTFACGALAILASLVMFVPGEQEYVASAEPEVPQEEKVEIAKAVEAVEIVEPVVAVAAPASTMIRDKGATVKFASPSAESSNRQSAVFISESDLKALIEQEQTGK